MKKKLLYILGGIFLGFLAVILTAVIALRVSVTPAAAAEATPVPEATPSPTPSAEPEAKYYTISFIGDCTLASSQYNNDFEAKMNGDYSYPFKNTVKYFTYYSL